MWKYGIPSVDMENLFSEDFSTATPTSLGYGGNTQSG
jgi:hypothetical protein